MQNNRLYTMLAGAFAIKKEYAETLKPQLMQALGLGNNVQLSMKELKELKESVMAENAPLYGSKVSAGSDVIVFRSSTKTEDVPAGSVALIRVQGFISAQGDWCMKGLNDYKAEMEAAGSNKNIKGVILQVNSCGGSIEGVENFSNFVAGYEKKFGKPLAAFIDAQADSAGYYILCQAPRIFVNGQSTEAGSIGTVVSAFDYKQYLEDQGIFERIAYASKSINKNKAETDFLNGDNTLITTYLDKYNDIFLRAVRRGRPQLNTSITITINDPQGNAMTYPEALSGTIYVGNEILTMGLADEITDLDGVVKYIEQRAMQMGLGNGSTTLVETEDKESEVIDEFSYNNTKLNINMYKHLSNQNLQSQFEAAKTDLNKIAGEKGATSKEFQAKNNEVTMMEAELSNRDLQAKFEKVQDDFKTAQTALTAKDAEIETLKTDLNAAKTAVNPEANEKLTALEAEKLQSAEILAAKEAELTALQAEKLALQSEKETLTTELKAHSEFIAKQGFVMPTVVVATSNKTEGDQPEGFKSPSPILSAKDQIQQMHRMRKEGKL